METVDKLVRSGELPGHQARKLMRVYESAVAEAVQSVSASHNGKCLEATMQGAVDNYAGQQEQWFIAVQDSVITTGTEVRYNAGSVELTIQSTVED
eukprot:17200-Heterococcus_DN1.PRE.4